MISKEEVKRIAALARLELSEKEIEKMQKDLSSILDYFDLLKKAPKETAEISAKDMSSLRKDEAVNGEIDKTGKLAKAFPDEKDGYIKVKAIL